MAADGVYIRRDLDAALEEEEVDVLVRGRRGALYVAPGSRHRALVEQRLDALR